ncbi:MAG TPA: efflux transporter outer membrane subunit [Burkholderiales bacterium]|nr:efflux transporter outer membrane subunit [Burkholderiales bacterium]
MKRAALWLLVLLLAACAGPRPSAPPESAIEIPTDWRTAPTSNGTLDAAWWQAFGDPVLAQIVEKALEHNVDIALAAERVEEARAQFRFADAQLTPTVDAVAQGARSRSLNAFGKPQRQNAGQAQLELSYEVDLFGRLATASAAAKASLLATEAAHDTVRLAVASSAASGYVSLRALDARLVILHETLEARAESLRVVRRRAETGYAATLDLQQAQADYHATEQLIPATELAIRRQEDALSLLLGENPRAIERGAALDTVALPEVPVTLPAELLRHRPDIAQAELQLVAADRSLDVARDAFLPTIRIGAAGGYVDSSIIADPVRIFSVGGSILAPIFEGDRLHAQADAAAARRNQAAYAYRKTALTAFREVEDSLAAVERNAAQEEMITAQRDALARVLTTATNRYRAGYSPYLEQLDAQRQLLSAELSLVQSRADRLAAIIGLYQSLGGGWQSAS